MVDPGRCPLCGQANACARVADLNAKDCWCTTQRISTEILARVPKSAVGCACICQGCIEAVNAARHDAKEEKI